MEFNYRRSTLTFFKDTGNFEDHCLTTHRKSDTAESGNQTSPQQRKLGQDVLSLNNRQFRSYSLLVYGRGKGTWRKGGGEYCVKVRCV